LTVSTSIAAADREKHQSSGVTPDCSWWAEAMFGSDSVRRGGAVEDLP
jgi:hypothetical protein